jgi:hypothetical protein
MCEKIICFTCARNIENTICGSKTCYYIDTKLAHCKTCKFISKVEERKI